MLAGLSSSVKRIQKTVENILVCEKFTITVDKCKKTAVYTNVNGNM